MSLVMKICGECGRRFWAEPNTEYDICPHCKTVLTDGEL